MASERDTICTKCQNIAHFASRLSGSEWVNAYPCYPGDHHSTMSSLRKSSKTCGICEAILEIIIGSMDGQTVENISLTWKSLHPQPSRLMKFAQAGDKMLGKLLNKSEVAVSQYLNGPRAMGVERIKGSGLSAVQFKFECKALETKGTIAIITCQPKLQKVRQSIWKQGHRLTTQDKIDTIREWLDNCRSRHGSCRIGTYALPKRLLDVGNDSSAPKLVYTENLGPVDVHYATLSHCWGGFQPLKTTKSTEERHQQSIKFQEFPNTFQDAIAIARALNIPYLWIDSLCIVQDDKLDWEHEAACMANIYKGSFLTIAAISSADGTGGCFVGLSDRSSKAYSRLSRPPFAVHDPESNQPLLVRVQEKCLKETDYAESPLSKRAWVLQELALSTRVLHCTSDGLSWNCNEMWSSEHGLSLSRSHTGRWTKGAIPKLHIKYQDDAHSVWWSWIENYSHRQLSVKADRAPAIAGITQHYQSLTDDTPILGLWKSTLVLDLQWYLDDKNGQENDDCPLAFPSWSWLSVSQDQPVFRYRNVWGFQFDESNEPLQLVSKTRLERWSLNWTAEPLTSALASAEMVLYGPVIPARVLKSSSNKRTKGFAWDYWTLEDPKIFFDT